MASLTSLQAGFSPLAEGISRKQNKVGNELNRMASGNRLQKAADDVASMSISTRMKARSATMKVVLDNMRQADNLLQIADKGLSQIQDILNRMAALASQSNSDGITFQERFYLNQEFQNLKEEIDRIAEHTNFNSQSLLNGEMVRRTNLIENRIIGTVPPPVTGLTLTGVEGAETLDGTIDDDTLQGLSGNDIINGGGGNDIFGSGVGTIGGVQGRIYRSAGAINNLAQAENIVATQPVWGSFIGTSLDYPLAGNSATSNVNNFLSGDVGSLTGGSGATAAERMVFVFEGTINVPADGTYTFSVGSDDGFNLRIDGTTVIQFTNNRGFGTTTGNRFLTAGDHSFRLLYWENSGGEGILARSNLGGAGLQVLNTTHLNAPAALTDGNDTLNGSAAGLDVAEYDGNQADYTITQLNPTQFQITDNRPNSPNGTDILNHINTLRFADGDMIIIPYVPPSPPVTIDYDLEIIERRKTIDYPVNELGDEIFSYEVQDARVSTLFANHEALYIIDAESAESSFNAILQATDAVSGMRAYTGAKMQQAGFVFAASLDNFIQKKDAISIIADTDIAAVSVNYAEIMAQLDASILMQVQATQLHEDVIMGLLAEE